MTSIDPTTCKPSEAAHRLSASVSATEIPDAERREIAAEATDAYTVESAVLDWKPDFVVGDDDKAVES